MFSIGLAGAGFMGATHADAYDAMDDVEIGAVAAPSGASEFIEEHGLDATGHASAAAMCEAADIDVVDVCTPTHTHRDVVETAADHGLATFCEKPLARTLEDAYAIADAVVEAGITFGVGHVLRFFPGYADARRHVEDGAIGDPGVARARRLSPFPTWGWEDWYADKGKSGGVFLDLAIHDFDFFRWLWGEVEEVFARRRVLDGPEHGTATLRFENGAVGYVDASWAQPGSRPFTTELELAGDEGLIALDSDDAAPYREFTPEESTVEVPVDPDGYQRELAAFLEAVEAGGDPPVTVDAAIAAMRLSMAAIESAERGAPVAPAEVEP